MSAGVVVGFDGSACAREALRVGLEVGKAYGEPVIVAFGYGVNPMAGEVADYAAALHELGEQRLAEATGLAADAGVEVEGIVVPEDPAPALAELARVRDARVIVVGTRGESPLRGALLGSTPHKLLALADRPVLVVPHAG